MVVVFVLFYLSVKWRFVIILVLAFDLPFWFHSSPYISSMMLNPTGKPRSKSQSRARSKTRSSSPTNNNYVSGRVLVDSYLREISSKSKLSVALDGMGIW